jgi:uncharacterized protein
VSDSLREQLLKAGFAPSRREKAGAAKRTPGGQSGGVGRAEPDLASAWALRARAERCEREAAAREARERAQAKRERKRKLQALLDGQSLNTGDAWRPRYFEYAGRIRRVLVTSDQMRRINAGECGIVVWGGRFHVVTRDVAMRAREVDPGAVALLVDPGAPDPDDGVPDDIVW